MHIHIYKGSLVIRQILIETTVWYHYTRRIAKKNKQKPKYKTWQKYKNPSAVEDLEQL